MNDSLYRLQEGKFEMNVVKDKYSINWHSPGIFQVDVHENAFLELEDILEIQTYKRHLTQGNPYVVLFVAPRFGNISKEAKSFLASDEGCKGAIAKAVVLTNLGGRIIYNYFITHFKPKVIHRAFNEKEKAMLWLNQKMSRKNTFYESH